MEPINLLIKPASGNCNMRCRYCFYEDEMQKRSIENYGFMTSEVLEKVIENALAYAADYCMIAFQGGEPTLVGLDFYRKVIAYANKYNRNHCKLEYAIQTNGYLIDDEWAEFFAENRFLVGVSLDGDKKSHNRYRVDRGGKETFSRVMETIVRLKKYKVDFNILTVVTAQMAGDARKIYNFYKTNQLMYQQYIECLDPLGETAGKCEYSLSADKLSRFLKQLFDMWYQDMMRGQYVYIRYFENIIMILAGRIPESCTLRGECGKQWVIESDGSVYPCDFYVLDEWKLGNLSVQSMEEIEIQREKSGFLKNGCEIPDVCKQCKWFLLCKNGCKRNRENGLGIQGAKNRYCEAYKEFFDYTYSRFLKVMDRFGIPVRPEK